MNQLMHQTIMWLAIMSANPCDAVSSLESTALFFSPSCHYYFRLNPLTGTARFPFCRLSLLTGSIWCYPPHRKKRSITVSFVQETPGGYICGVDVVNFKTASTHRIVVRLDTDTSSWQRQDPRTRARFSAAEKGVDHVLCMCSPCCFF